MTDPGYEDMAMKVCEQSLWIASAMTHLGQDAGMWDDEDGFFYDVLQLSTPNGSYVLNNTTVKKDASAADQLFGQDDLDWFLASAEEAGGHGLDEELLPIV